MVDFPTRGPNTLDQVFVNFAKEQRAVALPPLGRSDHCVVLWVPPPTLQPAIIKKRVRKFSKSNMAKFLFEMSNINWLSLVESIADLNESSSFFLNSIRALYDTCFPLRTVRMRESDPSWVRPSLKLLVDDRDKAYNNGEWSKYYRLRDEVVAHCKYLKLQFIKTSSSNPKDMWRAIRKVGGLSKPSVRINASAEDFNAYFASNFQCLDEIVPELHSSKGIEVTITPEEVYYELLRLQNKSPGPDNIPSWVFKTSAVSLCHAISYLFNRSVRESFVPPCLKAANVRPIPKTSKPASVQEFRPISLLPILSKLLEKIVMKKILLPAVIDKISPSQFAYIPRPGSGTVSALVVLQHRILEWLDSSPGIVRLLSVDFSKAFDKLPHQNIINACFNFDLPISIIKWIYSFLSGRQQRVVFDDQVSAWTPITSGIPQGSVLGPLLFCMAIDDLRPHCGNTTIVKYADDVCFVHFLREQAEDRLQEEWDNLMDWSCSTQLPVNLKKCQTMDIITKRSCTINPILTVDGQSVKQVNSLCFLGVHFSDNLKWNAHFDMVIKKASKRIFVLRNLRKCGCPTHIMKKAFFALMRSVLLYAYPAICNAPRYLHARLLRFESRISRIIGDPISPSILDVADSLCYSLLRKISDTPDHLLRPLFLINHSRHTRHSRLLRTRFTRTERFSSSFMKYANF